MNHRGETGPLSDPRGRQRRRDEDLEELLDDPHCRYLLDHLAEADGAVPVEELARHVVAGITDQPVDDVTPDVQRRVQTWLHHGQLPMLDDHGIVAFDPESGEARLLDEDLP